MLFLLAKFAQLFLNTNKEASSERGMNRKEKNRKDGGREQGSGETKRQKIKGLEMKDRMLKIELDISKTEVMQ